MPIVRRFVIGLTVASGLAAAALVVPADAGPQHHEFGGVGRSTTAPLPGRPASSTGDTVDAPLAKGSGTISVSGSVGGLYPGATLPLALVVSNMAGTPVTVVSVTTSVANASKLCKKVNLNVSGFTSGGLVIAADSHATVTVEATMALGAGDACQGAVFDLTYHGKATSR